MMKGISIAVLMLAVTGCDICTKSEECAKKSGTAFSITECRTQAQTSREQANTKGCGAEYGALESCAASLTCDQLNSANGLTTNCGAQIEKAAKCLN